VGVGWRVAVGAGVIVGLIIGALVGPCGCTTVAADNVRKAGVGVGLGGTWVGTSVGNTIGGLSPGTGGVANRAVMVACIRSASVIRTPGVMDTGVATRIGLPELALTVAATAAVIVASKSGFDDGIGVNPVVLDWEQATASIRIDRYSTNRGNNRPLTEESLLRESCFTKFPFTPHPCAIQIES